MITVEQVEAYKKALEDAGEVAVTMETPGWKMMDIMDVQDEEDLRIKQYVISYIRKNLDTIKAIASAKDLA